MNTSMLHILCLLITVLGFRAEKQSNVDPDQAKRSYDGIILSVAPNTRYELGYVENKPYNKSTLVDQPNADRNKLVEVSVRALQRIRNHMKDSMTMAHITVFAIFCQGLGLHICFIYY